MRFFLLALLFLSLALAFSPQYIEGDDVAYTCNCVLRDEFTTTTTSTAPPVLETAIPSREDLGRLPSKFWSLYNQSFRTAQHSEILSSNFIDRVLAIFRRRPKTTPPPIEPLNDGLPGPLAIRGLGKTIFTKYFQRLRKEWNILDRFTCKCQGELLSVLKARNYVSLTILHD